MKKIIILPVIFFALLWSGCEKESFNHKIYKPEISEIDSISFSPGAYKLIADGHASLHFLVETFRTATFTNEEGVQFDSLVNLDYNELPEGSVKIYDNFGNEIKDMQYSTDDHTPGTASFYVQIGDLTSDIMTVELREKAELPSKLNVDVIFHVFEHDPSDETYDKLAYSEIPYGQFERALENLNKIFNNEYYNGPNGASANIEFRLAELNPAGSKLAKAGYNKIYYSGGSHTVNVGIDNYVWDPKEYLNIFVMPIGPGYFLTYYPIYQKVPEGSEPMSGMGSVKDTLIPPDENGPNDYTKAITSLGVSRTVFNVGSDRRIEITDQIARYYGLRKAYYTSYVSDVLNWVPYAYNLQYQQIVKKDGNGLAFYGHNATDDPQWPSLRNTITLDQVKRIRYAIENCPGRSHGKTE